LPEAMEGPTPVSALIHAATMVTAGVFLIIRFSILFEYCPNISKIILFIGSLTALLSSLIGSFQYDIKKIIAYSTCSQLGYMFVGCGLSHYTLTLFHLFIHAFFKALLFLSSGLIIHTLNTQDIRNFAKTKKINIIIIIYFLIPSLSLCGPEIILL
jgi:NADH-quinone oxidoreductase subunit L